MVAPVIRAAVPDDLPLLREVERAAGEAFRALGMDAVADDEPPTVQELLGPLEDGRLLVVGGEPLAYLLVEAVDDAAHVEQVTVRPDQRGRGLGARLVDRAGQWGRERGLQAVTLTTYEHVPWNAPYYARLGFCVVAPELLGPQLRRVVDGEAARGLARWPRVAMRRLSPGPG